MKKLLILTAVLMLTVSSIGCQCDLFRRGALFPRTTADVPVYDPCPPCDPCNPCDPCAPSSCATPPSMILPGPGPATPNQ
jgi:hypothetical protein